jgi:hypothetical protein
LSQVGCLRRRGSLREIVLRATSRIAGRGRSVNESRGPSGIFGGGHDRRKQRPLERRKIDVGLSALDANIRTAILQLAGMTGGAGNPAIGMPPVTAASLTVKPTGQPYGFCASAVASNRKPHLQRFSRLINLLLPSAVCKAWRKAACRIRVTWSVL